MNSIKTSLFVLLVSFSFAACNGKSALVAEVNGRDITQAEFDAYLKLKHVISTDTKRRAAALDEYLERTAMAAVLEKEGKFDKAAVDAEVAEFRKELVISRYFDQFLTEKVSEEALKNYYDTHAATFEQRKVHVAHILVRTQPKMADAEKQAKRTTVQEIYSKLQSGQSFEELAKSASEDRVSGAKGGDLGWLREGSIDAEFSRRAFAGKAGAVTEPFETPFGFHILKVIEEAKVARKPYAAAVGDIRYQLRSETKTAEVKRLKDLAKIEKRGDSQKDSKAAASASAAPQPLPVAAQPKFLPPPEGPTEPPMGMMQPAQPQPEGNAGNPSNEPAVKAPAAGKAPVVKATTAVKAPVVKAPTAVKAPAAAAPARGAENPY